MSEFGFSTVRSGYCYRPRSVVYQLVCQSVCHLVSRAKTAEAIEMPFASKTRVGAGKTPAAYSGPLPANTVLCSFNTIQPSSYYYLYYYYHKNKTGFKRPL